MRKFALSSALGLLLFAGCGTKSESPPAAGATPAAGQSAAIKRYSMHGKVVSVNPADKSAKIDAAEVPGWMSAMTMDYPVKDTAELAKLAADKNIEATIFVDGDNFWIGEIKDATAPSGQKK